MHSKSLFCVCYPVPSESVDATRRWRPCGVLNVTEAVAIPRVSYTSLSRVKVMVGVTMVTS